MELKGLELNGILFNTLIHKTDHCEIWEGFLPSISEKVFIKCYEKKFLSIKINNEKFLNELTLLKESNHPFIATYINFFENSLYKFILLENLTFERLIDKIKDQGRVNEIRCRRYFAQLVSLIDYLHSYLRISHREINLETIYLDEFSNIRIIDFWESKNIINKDTLFEGSIGNLIYQSPEMILKQQYSYLVDMWGIGLILYILASGEIPIHDNQIEFNYPSFFSSSLVDILKKLLNKTYRRRISIDEIIEHPWFSKTEYSYISTFLNGIDFQISNNEEILNDLKQFNIFKENLTNEFNNDTYSLNIVIYKIFLRKKFNYLFSDPNDSTSNSELNDKKGFNPSPLSRRMSWELSTPSLLPKKVIPTKFKPKQLPLPSNCSVQVAARRSSSHSISLMNFKNPKE